MAYSVDVVVVGGATHAVSAALAAKKHGARVFLLAPRPYLGEDLCATLRLSLPAGSEPTTDLGRRLFPPPAGNSDDPGRSVPFAYTTDLPAAPQHPDTGPPSRLHDGAWRDATRDSVQYDGDVTLTVDLGSVAEVNSISLFAFEKPGHYGIGSLEVSTGDHPANLRVIEDKAEKTVRRETDRWSVVEFRIPVNAKARWIELKIERPDGLPRLLLGELLVETEVSIAKPETGARTSTPGHIKRELDAALLDAGIPFLYDCQIAEVLRDAEGNPAGIVMANRAGRQAVPATVIIDATSRATVARLAGAASAPWPTGDHSFRRFVIDRDPSEPGSAPARDLGPAPGGVPGARLLEYTLSMPIPDRTFASFAVAEQQARNLTWRPSVLDAAEVLFQVPPDPIETESVLAEDSMATGILDPGVFRPRNTTRIYVLKRLRRFLARSGRIDLASARFDGGGRKRRKVGGGRSGSGAGGHRDRPVAIECRLGRRDRATRRSSRSASRRPPNGPEPAQGSRGRKGASRVGKIRRGGDRRRHQWRARRNRGGPAGRQNSGGGVSARTRRGRYRRADHPLSSRPDDRVHRRGGPGR